MMNRFFNCGSASTFSSRSSQTLNRASRCFHMRFLDTILAQTFLIPNSSVSVKRTVSWIMSTSSAVVLTVHLRSDRTRSLTLAALSPVRVADGHPLRCSSPTSVLPSENVLCHLVLLTLHNLQWSAEVSNVFWWHFHRVQRTRRWHTAVRRFVLPFARQGSQTRPDTSSMYSTMRHCTATASGD